MMRIILLVVCALVFTGCSSERKELISDVDSSEAEMFAMSAAWEQAQMLMMRVDALCDEDNVEQAISDLEDAMNDEQYSRVRSMFFARLLTLMLTNERVDDASLMYLKAIETDEELTRSGFDSIYYFYLNSGNFEGVMTWTETMMKSPLPDDLAIRAFLWHISACINQGDSKRVAETVEAMLERFDIASCSRVFEGLFNSLVASKKFDDADVFLSVVADKSAGLSGDDAANLHSTIVVLKTQLLFTQQNWVEGEKYFLQTAAELPDAALARTLRNAASVALQNDQMELVDRLCGYIFRNQPQKVDAMREAARQCMAVGQKFDSNPEMLKRMELLVQFNYSPEGIMSFFRSHYFSLVEKNDKDELAQALSFGDRLAATVKNENDLKEYSAMALDLSFLMGDYNQSLKIVQDRPFDYSDAWKEMAINKIKAHIAEKEGRKEEAIERYRKFMDYIVKEKETPEYDASTGLSHTREMILGLNSARIGSILASMDDADGATKAYAEAREYYGKALSETSEDKVEYAHIKAELEKIPAVVGGE